MIKYKVVYYALNNLCVRCNMNKFRKIDGKKAYELARKGEAPDLKPVPVTIYSLDIKDIKEMLLGLTQ